MGNTPQGVQQGDSPIPPGPDGGCPQGYVLNKVDNMCYLVGPPISVTATGVSVPDVDYKNQGELTALGAQNSGNYERQALAHWHALGKMVPGPLETIMKGAQYIGRNAGGLLSIFVWGYMGFWDIAVSAIAEFISGSATRNNPLFWQTIGSLLGDLLGIELDGSKMYNDLQQRGTVAAMRDVGSGLINLLIGEFTGTAGGTQGNVTFSANVNPDTGLPEATLTPAGGIAAAQALMGFVLSSAVRQANIEGMTEKIPYGFGEIFEKYSEMVRENLGIGRMLRFALRPIFQDLVATPMKWAMNKQYRAKLFVAPEAARAFLAGIYTLDQFKEELALDGYSDARALALLSQYTQLPQIRELLTLRAAMAMTDDAFDAMLARHGFEQNSALMIRQAADFEPARKVSLAVAEHYMLEFARGNLTTQALRDFIDGLKTLGFLLTPGEVAALEAVGNKLTTTTKLRPRHLPMLTLKQAYIDGTITLDEYENHLRELGFSDSDVQILGIEVLIAAKKAAAAAAKHLAAGKKGSGPATSPTLATPPPPTATPTTGP